VADITYLRTWEGWLYLVAVQDLYSRRIVGWSMADHMRAELVTDALQMAVAHRRPDRGLIWHSDQGSQFVSLAFGQDVNDVGGCPPRRGSHGDRLREPDSRIRRARGAVDCRLVAERLDSSGLQVSVGGGGTRDRPNVIGVR
jgi:hypothetical protein